MRRNVAILLYDEVDPLAFAGPFEVFAVADELHGFSAFRTLTLAETPGTVRAANGLKLVPEHTLESAPAPHVLVLPGGSGVRALVRRPGLIEWIRNRARRAEITLAVGNGALLFARTGLPDALRPARHPGELDGLREPRPATSADSIRTFHDLGSVVAAGGISAGIDGALHVVGRLLGAAAAERTTRHLDYGRFAQPLGAVPRAGG